MPFYSYVNGSFLIENSIAKILKRLPSYPKYNKTYISNVLVKGLWSYPDCLFETMFEGIYRIPEGYTPPQSSLSTPIRHWSLNSIHFEPFNGSLNDALTKFRNKLKNSLLPNISPDKTIGIELSGGLDSAAIGAFIRNCNKKQNIIAFCNTPPSPQKYVTTNLKQQQKSTYYSYLHDDSKWSKLISDHLSLQYYQINDCYHFHDIIEQYTEVLGSFSEVLFPIINHRCYEIAHSFGIKTLFSGFGGDEVISQHAGLYLKELKNQRLYHKYLFERFMQISNKKLKTITSLNNFFKSKQSFWLPDQTHLQYLNIENLISNKETTQPRSVQEAELFFIEGYGSIHWQRRIETSTVIADHYGINMQFPLCSPDLMIFFHNLPSKYKFHNGNGRYLLRKSLQNLLPRPVIWRDSKKSATSPAATLELIFSLRELFLSRITKHHHGTIADYVNIPKLLKRIEEGPIFESSVLRLCIMVLMFAHLETRLKAKNL